VEHFAHDHLGPDEFERRVGAARGAGSLDELRALVADLPGGGGEERVSEAKGEGGSR
jgi:hypothetical protein